MLHTILCYFLYLNHLAFRRKILVKRISISDLVILQGNLIRLNFEVEGCHRIEIVNIQSLRGNERSARIRILNIQDPILIHFYGQYTLLTYELRIHGYKVDIVHQFQLTSRVQLDPHRVSNPVLTNEIRALPVKINLIAKGPMLEQFDSYQFKTLISK